MCKSRSLVIGHHVAMQKPRYLPGITKTILHDDLWKKRWMMFTEMRYMNKNEGVGQIISSYDPFIHPFFFSPSSYPLTFRLTL